MSDLKQQVIELFSRDISEEAGQQFIEWAEWTNNQSLYSDIVQKDDPWLTFWEWAADNTIKSNDTGSNVDWYCNVVLGLHKTRTIGQMVEDELSRM